MRSLFTRVIMRGGRVKSRTKKFFYYRVFTETEHLSERNLPDRTRNLPVWTVLTFKYKIFP